MVVTEARTLRLFGRSASISNATPSVKQTGLHTCQRQLYDSVHCQLQCIRLPAGCFPGLDHDLWGPSIMFRCSGQGRRPLNGADSSII